MSTTPRFLPLALAAALVVLIGCGGTDRDRAVEERASEERAPDDGAPGEREPGAPALPLAPEGLRWVGLGRVAVAVPQWWSVGETRCGSPVEDTVYVDPSASFDCPDPVDPELVRTVSSLAVLDGSRGYGAFQLELMDPVQRAGADRGGDGGTGDLEMRELAGCERWFPGVCRRLVGLPSEDLVLAVVLTEDSGTTFEEVRDSVRVLPPGLTAVPLDARAAGPTPDLAWTPTWGADPGVVGPLTAAIEATGLRVRVEEVAPATERTGLAADLVVGSYLGASPALGSVVESGSEVTVSVLGPRG